MKNVEIQPLSPKQLSNLISDKIAPTMSEDGLAKFRRSIAFTTVMWGGAVGGELKCLWGLIPPTLLSDEAYLWLHVIEPIGEHEFVFVRYSQQAIEEALKLFPRIIGHCEIGADRSIRWIKWLGGVFGDHEDRLVPFTIVRKHG